MTLRWGLEMVEHKLGNKLFMTDYDYDAITRYDHGMSTFIYFLILLAEDLSWGFH